MTKDKGKDHGGELERVSSIIGMGNLSPRFIAVTIFTSNFIGVVFARTLHYQFYCWYFHTLPYLLWHCHAQLPLLLRLAILASVEVSFNVYPATRWSSALLQVAHLVLLAGLYLTPVPTVKAQDIHRGSGGATVQSNESNGGSCTGSGAKLSSGVLRGTHNRNTRKGLTAQD